MPVTMAAARLNRVIFTSDSEIVDFVKNINIYPQYQLWSAMQATYGLRNHEIFYLDLERFVTGNGILKIVEGGKTEERLVWPVHPQWVEEFKLKDIRLPQLVGKNNMNKGQYLTRFFQRQGIGWQPYDLRHTWSIRCIHAEIDTNMAVKQQGHSIQVHCSIYERWLSEANHHRVFEAFLQRSV